ncbi:hypothetical protein DL98DRAFT_522246 [Cadophora sp. DSE1049]|nr:hypothetical protein DL98DRAFT_522245 [Cadophora sp. DSE1049]PVH69367.1 hypothetical protein DL98DRAFT_522246 [Cadophora sp. DSE1049]
MIKILIIQSGEFWCKRVVGMGWSEGWGGTLYLLILGPLAPGLVPLDPKHDYQL